MAILVIYATWRHLELAPRSTRLYLYIAVGIFASATGSRFCRLLVRNASWSRQSEPAKVTQIHHALQVQIHVTRPWKVRAGQYVYIWMSGVSFWSTLQSHPFAVCWWDDVQGKGSNIYLLIKLRDGFTQKLLRHANSRALSCWVDGPYGTVVEAAAFGSVLMFATGIGIAAQVPYLKEILQMVRDARAQTRSILLVWQLDDESKLRWDDE